MLRRALLMRCSHSVGLLLFQLEGLPLCAVGALNFAVHLGWLLPITGLFLLCPDALALLIHSTIVLRHLAFIEVAMHAVLSPLMPAVGKDMTSALPHSD